MRILHIVPASPYGGAQRLVIDLAAWQNSGKTTAEIIFTASDTAQADLALRAAERSGALSSAICGRPWNLIYRLRRAISRSGILAIHLHVPPPWMLATFFFKHHSLALIGHLHVRPTLMVHKSTRVRRIETAFQAALMRRCDRLIAISGWIADAWRAAHPSLDPCIVYNGIPTPERQLVREDRVHFTLGMASRLSDRKGVEEFLEVAAAVHKLAPDIRFVIAGDGPLRPRYERRVVELGLEHSLRFVGFVEDMPSFWRQLDLAAFTPPFEPFGLRLLEPLAHGLPVVAFRTGTGADEVIERCRGISSSEYGDIDALAKTVVELRAHPKRRFVMADEGFRDLTEHFSIRTMAAGVYATYQDVISTRGTVLRT